MGKEKRYWWLKLQDNFFNQKIIRSMRRKPNGAEMIIIYLKMQLASLRSAGVLTFDGLEDSFAEELACQIDEDLEIVKSTVDFLIRIGELIELSETQKQIVAVSDNVGSEGASAKRVREFRKRDTKSLQCNADTVTSSRRVRDRVREDIEIADMKIGPQQGDQFTLPQAA